MKFEVKKLYYYLACAVTLFVLMWGIIDFSSTLIGISLYLIIILIDLSEINNGFVVNFY